VVERTLGSAALRAWASASASAFLAASSRASRSSSSFMRSMSPLRMYFVGRGGTFSRAFRLEAISALRASMVVMCAKIDYLIRAGPSLFTPFLFRCPSTPSQCPTQTPLRGAPKAESHNLRKKGLIHVSVQQIRSPDRWV
jgi:hypothetical protein